MGGAPKYLKPKSKMANSLEQYEWDFIDPPMNDLYCPMCKEILKEPMLTDCCGSMGSHFCKACITPILETKKPCPVCKEPDFHCMIDKRTWNKVLELDVLCPLKGRGCNWKGEVGTREKHLDPDEGDCEYIDMDCTYGCGENMERYELAEHLDRFCHKRPYTCQHCGLADVYDSIANEHTPVCPKYPVHCGNKCGREDIPRASYDQHLLECPEQEIECEFCYAGCDVRLPRKNMPKHAQDKMHVHLSLQISFASNELSKRDQQLENLSSTWETKYKTLHMEIEERFSRLKQELEQKDVKISKLEALVQKQQNPLDEIHLPVHRRLKLKRADIVTEDVEIIVNSSSPEFCYERGVAADLNQASKGQLKKYTNSYLKTNGPLPVGGIALTQGGGELKCKHVIHAVGPDLRFNKADCKCLFNSVVWEVLKCAERLEVSSIAIPAISSGSVGIDSQFVARCVTNAIMTYKFTKPYPVLSDIRIVIIDHDEHTYASFARYFEHSKMV